MTHSFVWSDGRIEFSTLTADKLFPAGRYSSVSRLFFLRAVTIFFLARKDTRQARLYGDDCKGWGRIGAAAVDAGGMPRCRHHSIAVFAAE